MLSNKSNMYYKTFFKTENNMFHTHSYSGVIFSRYLFLYNYNYILIV